MCYALNADFNIKNGQVAHLDKDPSNSKFDNLCFLCLIHHDDYDTKRSQSKGFTITEVKRYRNDLYNAITSWHESIRYANSFPSGINIPELDFCDEIDVVIEKTSKETQIIERQAGIRLADKDISGGNGSPSLSLTISYAETKSIGGAKRSLHLRANLPFGLILQTEVCAWDDWGVIGLSNVLHNKIDIWMLRGNPIEGDERDPIYHARDFLLIYRKANGENRLNIS